jgi:hypothetical protein
MPFSNIFGTPTYTFIFLLQFVLFKITQVSNNTKTYTVNTDVGEIVWPSFWRKSAISASATEILAPITGKIITFHIIYSSFFHNHTAMPCMYVYQNWAIILLYVVSVMLLWVCIHTGQAWKICLATVGIKPTTLRILANWATGSCSNQPDCIL